MPRGKVTTSSVELLAYRHRLNRTALTRLEFQGPSRPADRGRGALGWFDTDPKRYLHLWSSRLQLVIIHYHLNRGGVTSVIRSHLQSLSLVASDLGLERVALAYGGRRADWSRAFEQELSCDVDHMVIPSLEYDDLRSGDDQLEKDLKRWLVERGYRRDSTVLHVHNHALGKHATLPFALQSLADEGYRMLLQVHDFVEDLRPQNYAHLASVYAKRPEGWSALYLQSPQVHYAALNQSDLASLADAGVASSRRHLLPNPVTRDPLTGKSEERHASKQKLNAAYGVPENASYVLYPVRGIRRKNLGELLLWAVLLKDCTFSVTLEPKNVLESRSYKRWERFADSRSLRVLFGSGDRLSIDENYAAADAVISTSVAEGFGLVFLEAALRDRPLFGRKLSGVVADFVGKGMQFPGLADEMLVPTSSFDMSQMRDSYRRWLHQLRQDYARPIGEVEQIEHQIDAMFRRDVFDFGRLDTRQQENVIDQACKSARLVETIRELNPCVPLATRTLQGESTLLDCARQNVDVIDQHFSLQTIGQALAAIYDSLLKCGPARVEASDVGTKLLERFVRPEHLFPLRIEP